MSSWSSVAVFVAAGALFVAFGGFAAISLAEGERRAARRSAMIAVVPAAPLLTSAFAPAAVRLAALTLLAIAGAAVVAVWLWPVGRRVPGGGRPSGRVDERDICPYSHPDNAAHNLVRAAIRRSGGARRALLRADDLFYRRRPTRRRS